MRKRVKVEFQDEKGVKYTLAVEGRLSKDKVMRMLDLMDLLEGPIEHLPVDGDTSTLIGRLSDLIEVSFVGIQFSSSDLAREYEERYNEPINLSTVSTNLARLFEKGYLKREKFSNSWLYQKIYLPAKSIPK